MKKNQYRERVIKRLEDLFVQNNWEETEITMKSTGLKIRLTPHFRGGKMNINNIDFIDADGHEDARLYYGTLDTVVDMLMDHDAIHTSWLQSNKELKKLFNEHNDNWSEHSWAHFANEYFSLYRTTPDFNHVKFD